MDNIDLSSLIKTKAEANDFSARLSSILEKMFRVDFHFETALLHELGIQKRDTLLALIQENHIATASQDDIKSLIANLQAKIASLPVLTLVVAFEVDEHTLQTIADWFYSNFQKQMLFDISVDRSFIAGAAVTFAGKFFDFSIKSQFDTIVKQIIEQESPNGKVSPSTNHQQIATMSVNK